MNSNYIKNNLGLSENKVITCNYHPTSIDQSSLFLFFNEHPYFQTNPTALNPFIQHLMGFKPVVSLKSLCSLHLPQWHRDTTRSGRSAPWVASSALVKGERKLVSYSPARQKLKLRPPRPPTPFLARYSKGTKRHRTAGFNCLTCGDIMATKYTKQNRSLPGSNTVYLHYFAVDHVDRER